MGSFFKGNEMFPLLVFSPVEEMVTDKTGEVIGKGLKGLNNNKFVFQRGVFPNRNIGGVEHQVLLQNKVLDSKIYGDVHTHYSLVSQDQKNMYALNAASDDFLISEFRKLDVADSDANKFIRAIRSVTSNSAYIPEEINDYQSFVNIANTHEEQETLSTLFNSGILGKNDTNDTTMIERIEESLSLITRGVKPMLTPHVRERMIKDPHTASRLSPPDLRYMDQAHYKNEDDFGIFTAYGLRGVLELNPFSGDLVSQSWYSTKHLQREGKMDEHYALVELADELGSDMAVLDVQHSKNRVDLEFEKDAFSRENEFFEKMAELSLSEMPSDI